MGSRLPASLPVPTWGRTASSSLVELRNSFFSQLRLGYSSCTYRARRASSFSKNATDAELTSSPMRQPRSVPMLSDRPSDPFGLSQWDGLLLLKRTVAHAARVFAAARADGFRATLFRAFARNSCGYPSSGAGFDGSASWTSPTISRACRRSPIASTYLRIKPSAYVSHIHGLPAPRSRSRSSTVKMRETLSREFVKSARARGLSELRVVFRHAFPNAMLPVVTVMGVHVGHMLAGSVLTETVFAW